MKPKRNPKVWRVLVFPCGSECGLEIGRSLSFLKDIRPIGASSIDDHGKFVFEEYIGGLPFITDPSFLVELNRTIRCHDIDFVFPAMDSVVSHLAESQSQLDARVIGSPAEVAEIALSKRRTYARLRDKVRCPHEYPAHGLSKETFPVFLKPAIGYGSRGTLLARSAGEVQRAIKDNPGLMILEYLPGEEFTVDCFSDFSGTLCFANARQRKRIARGISVNTHDLDAEAQVEFFELAKRINGALPFNGAWFCQFKRASNGQLALLEVAPRIAGSMGLQRYRGVNLPLLSVYNALGLPVEVLANRYHVEFDRALYGRTNLAAKFGALYVDFDDCFLLADKYINPELLRVVAKYKNAGKKVALITRHRGTPASRLEALGVRGLFDAIIHLKQGETKADYIAEVDALLIDDSFVERAAAQRKGIAALGPDAIDAL